MKRWAAEPMSKVIGRVMIINGPIDKQYSKIIKKQQAAHTRSCVQEIHRLFIVSRPTLDMHYVIRWVK